MVPVKLLDTCRALDPVNLKGHMVVVGHRTGPSDLVFGVSNRPFPLASLPPPSNPRGT